MMELGTNGTCSVFPNQSFMDLSLYQFGYGKNEPLSGYGPHIRAHYIFHYIISGAGTLKAISPNGKECTYRVRSGQGFMIYPGQATTYFADEIHPWEYTWIEFDGLHAQEVLRLAGLTVNSPIYRSCNKQITQQLKDTMLELAMQQNRSLFWQIGRLYDFVDCLINSSASKIVSEDSKMGNYYLKIAIMFIEQHVSENITVEDIAAACKIHRNHLGKVFRAELDKSPQEFLISYRMSKASQFLLFTKLSVKAIGQEVGYPNQLHFSRAFKNVYGVSPKQWRDEHKNDSVETIPLRGKQGAVRNHS